MIQNLFKRILFIAVMLLLSACVVTPRPSILIPKNAPPVPPAPPPQVTLVLGSGGARAFAEIGVIKVLEEKHIPIDLVIGTSSGSIVGAIYADNPSWRHVRRTLAQAQPSDLIDISALHILEGPITGNALQNFILTHVKARDFRHLKLRFIAVATDLRTGASVPIESGPIAPAINASSALPPYFRPVPLYGHMFIDGSTTDPIAVDIAQLQRSKVIIAVNVAADFVPYVPGNLISNYDRTYTINDYVFNMESAEGADVVIHPKIGEVGIFDATQKYALIQAGEIAARNALPQICAVLSKNYIVSDCSHGKPKPKKALEKIKDIIKKDLSSLKLKK